MSARLTSRRQTRSLTREIERSRGEEIGVRPDRDLEGLEMAERVVGEQTAPSNCFAPSHITGSSPVPWSSDQKLAARSDTNHASPGWWWGLLSPRLYNISTNRKSARACLPQLYHRVWPVLSCQWFGHYWAVSGMAMFRLSVVWPCLSCQWYGHIWAVTDMAMFGLSVIWPCLTITGLSVMAMFGYQWYGHVWLSVLSCLGCHWYGHVWAVTDMAMFDHYLAVCGMAMFGLSVVQALLPCGLKL